MTVLTGFNDSTGDDQLVHSGGVLSTGCDELDSPTKVSPVSLEYPALIRADDGRLVA